MCSKCKQIVILKHGRIKTAHFADKLPTDCTWAKGETLTHLDAKKLFRNSFALRGLQTEVEFIVPSLPSDRRADVMVWSPSRTQAAIELQHCNIGIEEIEKRAFSYAREGIAQAWVPFPRPKVMAEAKRRMGGESGDLLIGLYPARPFERWVHAFHFGRPWFYDPKQKTLWHGHFSDHDIWVEGASWYNQEWEEVYAVDFPPALQALGAINPMGSLYSGSDQDQDRAAQGMAN
jgi:hypothetical protein